LVKSLDQSSEEVKRYRKPYINPASSNIYARDKGMRQGWNAVKFENS
jgi:hypothetical protein